MMLLILLIGIALVILSVMGTLPIPIWVGFAVMGFALLMFVFGDAIAGFGASKEDQVQGGTQLNACGCPGAVVYKKKRWPRKDQTAQASCSLAQQLVRDKPKKFRIVGCI